jgi:ABC-type uncharacterized transport system permease subunit
MTSNREIKNRQWLDWAVPVLTAVLAVVAAFAVGALFIIILGADPVEAYKAIIVGAFGNVNALTETMIKAAPLVITAAGPTSGTLGRKDSSLWAAWPRPG